MPDGSSVKASVAAQRRQSTIDVSRHRGEPTADPGHMPRETPPRPTPGYTFPCSRDPPAPSELAAVRVGDVDGSGRVLVRTSKTDEEGRGSTLYLGRPTMRAVSGWLQTARCRWTGARDYDEGPLFRRVTRSGAVSGPAPLLPEAVRAIIRKRARAAGLDGRVSGHSLRVGTAQDLVCAGADLPALMQAGRWSDAATAAGYASGELASRGAVARFLYGGGK